MVWLDTSKETRTAARGKRLIAGELLQAHTVLTSIILQGLLRGSVDMATVFPVSAWQEYGAHLEGISAEVRDFAVTVYTELLVMRGSLAWFRVQQSGGALSQDMIEALKGTDARVTKVRTALGGQDVST